MKVTIKEWNAVASWRWDMPEDDVCGICRVQFDGTCPTCKYPGDDCTLRELYLENFRWVYQGLKMSIVIGKCGHSFHMVRSYSVAYESAQTYDAGYGQHCLLTWIQQDSSKGLCPMCRQSRTSHAWTLDDAETVIQNSNGSKVENESEVERLHLTKGGAFGLMA